ncbi:MAG: peptidyl-prolyl cis-trans isomerase, partial [Bacteroidota bacterium]
RTSDSHVARVNDSYLTMEELREHTDTTSIASPQAQAYVSRWVSRELLFQEARRRGLDKSPEIESKINEIEKQLIVTLLLDTEIYNQQVVDFSNEELLGYFENHTEEFFLQTDVAKANYALFHRRESANAFRTRVRRGTPWFDAVNDVKKDTVASAAIIELGDSLYITEQKLFPPAVWRVLIRTSAGQISFPVKTDQGYFVFQLLGFQKRGTHAEFRYSLPEIRERLIVEKRRKLLDSLLTELRQRYTVEVNLGQISEQDTLHGSNKQ